MKQGGNGMTENMQWVFSCSDSSCREKSHLKDTEWSGQG